jgi:hypothetical protein
MMDIEDRYITEQIPSFNQRQLTEELAYYRRQTLGEFRLDEGMEDDPRVYRASARLRALEKRAQEIGLSESEIVDAHTRVEARERFWQTVCQRSG